ncbi:hypothetical protein AB0A71_32820 [Kitasatospora aureofaciens]|uniref:hypothetical protein n=1 Tax=Kitasatospora aureofaciens TaxID=1894 RepID=UPI00340F6427
MRQSFDDARSIRTWDGAGLDDGPPPAGPRARQAWCYGTPGVSWALWDAADAVGEALCHGASGVLAVADTFAHHAGLPAAAALRTRLLAHLRARLPEIEALGAEGMGLLGGAAGPLCALLTAGHGASRAWLSCLGLR